MKESQELSRTIAAHPCTESKPGAHDEAVEAGLLQHVPDLPIGGVVLWAEAGDTSYAPQTAHIATVHGLQVAPRRDEGVHSEQKPTLHERSKKG